jgi:macrolide transport system ATP-binding/permease protein
MNSGENSKLKFCLRLYRALACAYPHEFRMLYGEDLERLGEDAAPEIWRRHGVLGLIRLLADIALRLPAEYLSELRGDVRFALRMLAKSPGFAAVGIVSLALGIGVCSFFFNAFTVASFRPLAGVDDRATLAGLDTVVPYAYFEHYREQPGVAAAAAFTGPIPFAVARYKGTKSERVFGNLVSPEYFNVLGLRPLLGRFFRTDTEKPGAAPVVVISERFWRAHLNSDPQAVGRTLRVNSHSATILGVAPKDFAGVWPIVPADLFVPVTSGASIAPELAENAKPDACYVVIRTAPGVKPSAVEAALDVVTQRLDDEQPGAKRAHNQRHVHLLSVDGLAPLPESQRVVIFTFFAVLIGLVLSLACTNLANLLLARSSQRRQEIAIRLSVGAGRFRLVRQLLTESLILSLARFSHR